MPRPCTTGISANIVRWLVLQALLKEERSKQARSDALQEELEEVRMQYELLSNTMTEITTMGLTPRAKIDKQKPLASIDTIAFAPVRISPQKLIPTSGPSQHRQTPGKHAEPALMSSKTPSKVLQFTSADMSVSKSATYTRTSVPASVAGACMLQLADTKDNVAKIISS